MRTLNRLTPWLSFVLLAAGSLIFIGGGRLHPHVGNAMGPLGSADYFLHFARTIMSTAGWVPMHVMILVGPVLWALAAPATRAALPEGGAPLWATAQVALTISAALWAVVFVVDGFVAPVFAAALVAAPAGAPDPALLASFAANQTTVIRLGLISWILNGAAIALFSVGLLFTPGRSYLRIAVGVTGLLLGVWPIVAAITGEFLPGPFTSDAWKETALVTSIWYLLLGVTLASTRGARAKAV
ncbi:MAG: hypothetical protein M3O61_17915 [Gemmatimonadota bacterium]|nr:hypothetical protein [Gemmatimonadota bacterium]